MVLYRVRQCCRTTVQSRSPVAFSGLKNEVNAAELVAARREGSLRANASHLFGAEAQALVTPDRS